jgi:hypothetical protein
LRYVVGNAIVGVQNAFIGFYNIAVKGINLLIKGANLFGAGLEPLEELAYKAFVPLVFNAEKATKKVLDVALALQEVKNAERMLEGKGTTTETIPKLWVVVWRKQLRRSKN